MKKKILKIGLVILELILVGVCSLILVRNICYTPIVISETSMYPTLQDGDYGYVINTNYALNNIKRFDVVTCKVENREYELIKRVIGLPNETIEFRGEDCQLWVINGDNEELIDQDFVSSEVKSYTGNGKYVIPEDSYFVLGDNRKVSVDSRSFGTVEKENITGILKVVIANCLVSEDGEIIEKNFKPFVYF